jgi:benzylsuccinate CoA-transferase BbsF subunit
MMNTENEGVPQKLMQGVRVVDFSWYVTGPITTKHLADLGAEVIIVESRRRPGWRRGPPLSGTNDQICTSKLSITVNTRDPRGLELAKQLIARSDVMVENYAGGTINRMGLGYEAVSKIKPDIIMLSTSMLGQTGPYSAHQGSGHKLTGLAGFNHILGWPDRPPGWIGAYTDFIAPRYAIVAIMAALEYRRRTGKGQYLDVSQLEASLQFMSPLLLDYDVNRRVADRMGNRAPYAAPHNAYRCRGEDRWCAISVRTDRDWRNLCLVMGSPALADEPRFSTLTARKEHEQEMDRLINEWTRDRPAEEVMISLQAAGVAAGVLQTGEDLLDYDPQLAHRGTFTSLEYPGIGKYRAQSGAHFLMSGYKVNMSAAPTMGQHNEYVFKGILGMSSPQYEQLVEDGVIA